MLTIVLTFKALVVPLAIIEHVRLAATQASLLSPVTPRSSAVRMASGEGSLLAKVRNETRAHSLRIPDDSAQTSTSVQASPARL